MGRKRKEHSLDTGPVRAVCDEQSSCLFRDCNSVDISVSMHDCGTGGILSAGVDINITGDIDSGISESYIFLALSHSAAKRLGEQLVAASKNQLP